MIRCIRCGAKALWLISDPHDPLHETLSCLACLPMTVGTSALNWRATGLALSAVDDSGVLAS